MPWAALNPYPLQQSQLRTLLLPTNKARASAMSRRKSPRKPLRLRSLAANWIRARSRSGEIRPAPSLMTRQGRQPLSLSSPFNINLSNMALLDLGHILQYCLMVNLALCLNTAL